MIAKANGRESRLPTLILPDIQAERDTREVAIDRVGVTNVRYPMVVVDRHGARQPTVATVNMYVELPHEEKGTHMSRFLEVLHEQNEISPHGVAALLGRLRERLDAPSAQIELEFPYFVRKRAPVTGAEGWMEFTAGFRANARWDTDLVTTIRAPVKTLCPCSREISENGAHNQRGIVDLQIRSTADIGIDELIEIVEGCASCALYPVLKRADEKYVTERAYANPRFVEDLIREVAVVMREDPRVIWYRIAVENQESIHAHNAYAALERWK
jgi:GTP cyclohydrolase IB